MTQTVFRDVVWGKTSCVKLNVDTCFLYKNRVHGHHTNQSLNNLRSALCTTIGEQSKMSDKLAAKLMHWTQQGEGEQL